MNNLRHATTVCLKSCLIATLLGLLWANIAQAQLQPAIHIERLADAIYKAENSKNHPYGIMQKYKHTTPRQACINTIKSALKRFALQTRESDFIAFLGKTYAPIGAKNDPNNLNKNWVRNVKMFYERNK